MSSKTSDVRPKKRNGKQKNKKKGKNTSDVSTFSMAQLMTKAQECVDVCSLKAAYNYVDYAVKKFKPENRETLEFCANIYIDCQNFEDGRSLLQKAVTLYPDNGHTKYFSLAQMYNGGEALEFYIKGTEVLQNAIKICTDGRKDDDIMVMKEDRLKQCEMEETETNNDKSQTKLSKQLNEVKLSQDENATLDIKEKTIPKVQEGGAMLKSAKEPSDQESSKHSLQEIESLQKQLSFAFCAISELYTLPDLCDEDNAEEKCVSFIQKSLDTAEVPDAYYYQANYNLIKGDIDEAKISILKSVSLWLPKYRALEEGKKNEGDEVTDTVEAFDLTPQFRIQIAKVLIEVGEMELANEVLEGVMGEDDECAEVWYMIGFNLSLNGTETQKPSAKYHLKKALDLHNESEDPEDEMVEHIKEMLDEMKDVETEDEDDQETAEDEEMEEMEVDENGEMEVGASGS